MECSMKTTTKMRVLKAERDAILDIEGPNVNHVDKKIDNAINSFCSKNGLNTDEVAQFMRLIMARPVPIVALMPSYGDFTRNQKNQLKSLYELFTMMPWKFEEFITFSLDY